AHVLARILEELGFFGLLIVRPRLDLLENVRSRTRSRYNLPVFVPHQLAQPCWIKLGSLPCGLFSRQTLLLGTPFSLLLGNAFLIRTDHLSQLRCLLLCGNRSLLILIRLGRLRTLLL